MRRMSEVPALLTIIMSSISVSTAYSPTGHPHCSSYYYEWTRRTWRSGEYDQQRVIPWKLRNTRPILCIIQWMGAFRINQQVQDFYIKIKNTTSSTLVSIAARIADANAIRTNANITREDRTTKPKVCCFWGTNHIRSKISLNSATDNTNLWKILKDPVKREMSIYFFFMIDWSWH